MPSAVISDTSPDLMKTTDAQMSTAPVESVSYEDESSMHSFLVLGYMNRVYDIGEKKPLELEDLGKVSKQDDVRELQKRFAHFWALEKAKPKEARSLWMVLWRTVGWWRVALGVGLYAVWAALSYGPVLILNELVKYFQGSASYSKNILWLLVCLIFIIPCVGGVAYAHSNAVMAHIGVQFRNVLVNAIYRKSLKLSPSSRQDSSTGQIVNMFSNDTKQIQAFLYFLTNAVIAPFQIIVCIALIYLQMKEATFVGVGYMVILLPANGLIFFLMNKIRKEKVQFTDIRVKLMNEILGGIRIIKYYAWERAFATKILEERAKEMERLTVLAYISAVGLTLVMMAAPIIQPVLIFYTYVQLGNQLDAATAFTTLSLFNLLAFPFAFLPLGLTQYSQSKVSTDRMLAFFDSEELDDYVSREARADGVVVSMENVSMSWMLEPSNTIEDSSKIEHSSKIEESSKIEGSKAIEEAKDKDEGGRVEPEEQGQVIGVNRSVLTLSDITISVPRGALVAVVGPVGSGKSSLLGGFLGELILSAGKVHVSGSIAYCDQRPWILNATIRDNILFGLPYDEQRFEQAIHACNLHEDIRILPGGLLTEIGERGINLSGGQKARVALARAVYRDADVYLLDDPLSAVDAHVGQWLFAECMVKQLAGKTRILVTHQVHLLPQCDLIVVLVEGRIKAMGSFDQIAGNADVNVDDILGITREEHVVEHEQLSVVQEEEEEEVALEAVEELPKVASTMDDQVDKTKENETIAMNATTPSDEQTPETPLDEGKLTKIMTLEEKQQGDVPWSAYSFYFKAGGILFFLGAVMFAAGSQVLALLGAFWLAHWGTIANNELMKGRPLDSNENVNYLNIYALYAMLGVAALTIRSLLIVHLRLGTSLKLHQGLLAATLSAPIAFFDITPVGRILNRFSSDMLTIDEELSQTLMQLANAFFQSLGAIGAIAGATNGTFLILLVPIAFFYGHLQNYFRKSNTAIARIEAISRSPIYADFSQALNGMTTIRAYKDGERFINVLEGRVNANSVAAVMQQVGANWLAMRLDFFGSIISFFVALLCALTMDSGFISAGLLAVGLSYSFQLTAFLKFAVRMAATFEAQMNSVERIKYYMDTVVAEENPDGNFVTPPADWPTSGAIEGRGVQMRYREGPLVIKGIDFSIASKETVGIAGRTGSGKSSLMVALFRMQELAGGQILIDGVDCATVSLSVLRSKLGIIPQDPVMFSATVRFNLDPFDEHSDKDLWDVLRSVDMDGHVSSLPSKLLEEVAEGGDNFSAGQRQLICIARALLRNPKILVMDEATASVDNDTDALIQLMVRERFKNSTVLTIAHRLNTIIDYDKIMVLDSGHLVEMDTPAALLGKFRGSFKALWDKHQSSHGLTKTYSSNSLSSDPSAMKMASK